MKSEKVSGHYLFTQEKYSTRRKNPFTDDNSSKLIKNEKEKRKQTPPKHKQKEEKYCSPESTIESLNYQHNSLIRSQLSSGTQKTNDSWNIPSKKKEKPSFLEDPKSQTLNPKLKKFNSGADFGTAGILNKTTLPIRQNTIDPLELIKQGSTTQKDSFKSTSSSDSKQEEDKSDSEGIKHLRRLIADMSVGIKLGYQQLKGLLELQPLQKVSLRDMTTKISNIHTQSNVLKWAESYPPLPKTLKEMKDLSREAYNLHQKICSTEGKGNIDKINKALNELRNPKPPKPVN